MRTAERRRVQVAAEQLLVADPRLDRRPVVHDVAQHLELGAVALVGGPPGDGTARPSSGGSARPPCADRLERRLPQHLAELLGRQR